MWETNAEFESERPTASVATLATAKTDSKGRYVLRTSPTPAIERAVAKNDGWVNLTVHATTENGEYITQAVSRAPVDDAWSSKGRTDYEPTKDVPLTFAYDSSGTLLNGGPLTESARQTMTSDRDPIC